MAYLIYTAGHAAARGYIAKRLISLLALRMVSLNKGHTIFEHDT